MAKMKNGLEVLVGDIWETNILTSSRNGIFFVYDIEGFKVKGIFLKKNLKGVLNFYARAKSYKLLARTI